MSTLSDLKRFLGERFNSPPAAVKILDLQLKELEGDTKLCSLPAVPLFARIHQDTYRVDVTT